MTAFALVGAENRPTNNPPRNWPESRSSQLIFFAVLEGLYRDGVPNSDVDLIIPPGKDGGATFTPEHFVYACPLCHPAFEALRLYRQRQEFFGLKARINEFGPGLSGEIAAQVRNPDPTQRRQAVEKLISRWVSERLEMMRLTKDEREAITREIEQGRKQGMGGLKQTAAQVPGSQSRTNCPICDGSFGACKLKPQ